MSKDMEATPLFPNIGYYPHAADAQGSRMTENSPTNEQKALVDEALLLRGRIIAAYCQVEFLLADISVKLDLRFPYLIKDRIRTAKRIATDIRPIL
jgi:hypothetical protein